MAPPRKNRTAYRRIRHDIRHPLCPPSGMLTEARAALFDRIGWGPHPCHWCGIEVEWVVGERNAGLIADHVDGDPLNDDDPANLVPSCVRCNLVRQRTDLWTHPERTCELCGATFVVPSTNKRARFCGKSCSKRWQWQHANLRRGERVSGHEPPAS